MQVLNYRVLGNPLYNWILTAAVFILLFSILVFLKNKALSRVRARAMTTQTRLDDIFVVLISKTHLYAILSLALWLSSLLLNLAPGVSTLLRTVFIVLLLLQLASWGNHLITWVVAREVKRRVSLDDQSSTTINLLGFFAKVILWTVILMVVMDNLPNVKVDTLITSLGITGVAVAIAVQRILSDLFASLSIALDKPFVIGDFIIIDNHQGTVEDIGLKSTRIRSLFGEQIVVSNSDLLNSRIQNYKRMVDRRVTFSLKVSPASSLEQLANIPTLIQEIIQSQEQARFGRAHFLSIGETFYLYEIVYSVLSPSYELYMDIQQNINLAILKRFQQEGITLAMA